MPNGHPGGHPGRWSPRTADRMARTVAQEGEVVVTGMPSDPSRRASSRTEDDPRRAPAGSGDGHPGAHHPADPHPDDEHSYDGYYSYDDHVDDHRDDHSDTHHARARLHWRRRRRRRSAFTLVLTIALLAGAIAAAWFGLRPLLSSAAGPDDYAGPGTGQVSVVIDPGDTGGTIGRELEAAGVVLSAKRFIQEAKADPRAQTIQPGTYVMKKEMSVAGALEVLVDPQNRVVTRVTVIEGMRVAQVAALLVDKGFDAAAVEAAIADPAAIGLPEQAGGRPEGWLHPATYEFEPGTSPAAALSVMVTRTEQELTDAGVPPADQQRVLTEASIIQAEAGLIEDYPKVARVIANRLAAGRPLQMDSTVSYATQTFNENTTAAQRAVRSPFNTYLVKGLPPGAINNPGRAAIDAALNPADGAWLFFVTVNLDTGLTKFAVTEAEHQRNVAEYQAWARANR